MKSSRPAADGPPLEDTLAPASVARRWGVSLATVRAWLGSGELDFCQIGGKLRIPLQAVHAFEKEQRHLLQAAPPVPARKRKP